MIPYMAKGPRAAKAQKPLLESEECDVEGMRRRLDTMSQVWRRKSVEGGLSSLALSHHTWKVGRQYEETF